MEGRFCGIFARRRGALGRRWDMGLDIVIIYANIRVYWDVRKFDLDWDC